MNAKTSDSLYKSLQFGALLPELAPAVTQADATVPRVRAQDWRPDPTAGTQPLPFGPRLLPLQHSGWR